VRKQLKRLRYTAEFFLPLFDGDDAGRFVKRLKRMLDTFGYLNDVAMAEMLTDICRAEGSADTDRDSAAGYVLGWHTPMPPGAVLPLARRGVSAALPVISAADRGPLSRAHCPPRRAE
jgi:triphosphatase